MSEEANWIRIQQKTFTGWCNANLRKIGESIADLQKDFEDGVKLIHLLEVISGNTIDKKSYDRNAKMRIKKVINVGVALKFIEASGVRLANIGPEEIVDGNLKMILGMIWTIILRFQIQDISEEELSAKEALLLWCQKKTKGYNNVDVQNFHMSFQDGLAFCALIHKHRPDLIDFDSLSKENKKENLKLAFDVAEKHLDIPQILDPNDIVDIAKPDERSIMTYVAALYHVFATGYKADAAAKKVSNVLDFEAQAKKLKDEYARRAQALKDWILTSTNELKERDFPNSVEGVQGKISEFKAWKQDQKAPQGKENLEVEALFNQIQTKLRINKRPPYVPPEGLSPQDIATVWNELSTAESERGIALREELKRLRYLANLVASFKLRHTGLDNWVQSKSKVLSADAELGNTIDAVNANLRNLDSFFEDYTAQSSKLASLEELKTKIVEGGHADAAAIEQSLEEFKNQWDELQPKYDARKEALETQLKKLQQVQSLLVEFAKKALGFVRWVEVANDTLSEPIVADSVAEVKVFEDNYEEIVNQVQSRSAEFDELSNLVNQLHEAEVQETSYSEYSFEDINTRWSQVQQAVEARKEVVAAEHERQVQNEELRTQWAEQSQPFYDWIVSKEQELKDSSSGELEEQLERVNGIISDVTEHQGQFDNLIQLNQQIEDAEINTTSSLTYDAVRLAWEGLHSLGANTKKVLENEILLKQHAGVTAEEIAEYKETFSHFDKDGNNQLNRLELKSCLQSLGDDPKDPELDAILSQYGLTVEEKEESVQVLPFDAFVAYMVNKNASADTKESLIESFKVMAGDKEFITANDLNAVLPTEQVQFLLENMPAYEGVPDGYDYKAYAATVYA